MKGCALFTVVLETLVCLVVKHTPFSLEGHRLADRHDRQLPVQHRRGRHHVLLLQLEADAAHPVLPAFHRPVRWIPGQDADGLREAGQAGHGSCRPGQKAFPDVASLSLAA